MRAVAGDRIIVPGRHVGDVDRGGEVTEVRGTGDSPLYVVVWDDGHEGICSPGPETRVQHPAGA